jgi:hypothetical protein
VLVMVSNATGIEVGLLAGKHPGRVGHLFSPGGQRGPWREIPHAFDNNRFPQWEAERAAKKVGMVAKPWDEARWLHMLRWGVLAGIPPLWASVPDRVADRDGTLRDWERYAPTVKEFGFRCAFVVQNGMTFEDVPDSECMLFLGGDDTWKDANITPWCYRFPGRVHVGRVNTPRRLIHCWKAGAVSVDGTGWFRKGRGGTSQFNDLRKFLRETNQPSPLRSVA